MILASSSSRDVRLALRGAARPARLGGVLSNDKNDGWELALSGSSAGFSALRSSNDNPVTVRAEARTPPKKAGQATTLALISGAGSSRWAHLEQ